MKKREENDAVLSTYFFFYRRGRERGERRDRETERQREREESGWEDGPKERKEIHIN